MTVERTEITKTARKTPATASKIPANAKRPDDHRTAKAEVGAQDTVVEWKGVEYVVEADNMDDAELLEYFTDENFVGAVRILVGMEGWTRYKAAEKEEHGKVSATGTAEFLGHVLAEVKAKNS